jgi:hypothetical protein
MITENPFKEKNGSLKARFSFYNNTLWFAGGVGGKDVPAFKSCRVPWSIDDCPHIGKRLKMRGATKRELSELLEIKESSVERFIFVGPIPRKHRAKLNEIESIFKGE